ncbi:MAG: UDP-N-acetylmuramate--L-alanine ligase [Patescibacteria group bacterium]|jgi:UDP-N-acetylmuramate--alanine ligase
MDLSEIKKIHFVGIGGIGISAVARVLNFQKKEVSGSDATESEITEQLSKEGINIIIGHRSENIKDDIDLVVYSVAVPEDNCERQEARKLKINTLTYPDLLGFLMKDKYAIGISGTNGKTTTTAMLGKIFVDAGMDPTIILGSKADYLGGNSRVGNSKYFIFESDEYRRAFDNYNPKVAVNTYIGEDHLDYYKNAKEIKMAFKKYFEKLPGDGMLVINNDDSNSSQASAKCQARIITYGLDNESDFTAKCIHLNNGKQYFDVFQRGNFGENFFINIPGRFNVYDALASIAVARQFNIRWEVIRSSLAGFNGAWRRFEKLGHLGKALLITDYAHTPDAVYKTIEATKEFFPSQKILVVFQPHQFARTKNLFNEFVQSFSLADMAIISDIYYVEGRERPEDFDINSVVLAEEAKNSGANAVYGGSLNETENLIRTKAGDFDVILIMGAGNIYDVAQNLVKK